MTSNNQKITIECPSCHHAFALDDIYAKRIEANLRKEFSGQQSELAARQKAVTEQEELLKKSRAALDEEVAKRLQIEKESLLKTEREKIQGGFNVELKDLKSQLSEKKTELEKAQTKELEYRKKIREVEDKEKNLELEIQRKVDEQTEKQKAAVKQEADSEIARLKKQFEIKEESLKSKMDEMQKRLDQGSMQTQGETFELVLEDELNELYPSDSIEPVAKGVKGADILQTVNNKQGKACGQILWECKDTKAFSEKWIAKLKDDQRACKADLAVIVTNTLPKDVTGFEFIDGVWVTNKECFAPLCSALRMQIIQVFASRQANVGKGEKIEAIYHYISGHEFRQRVHAIVEAFTNMRIDLEKEKTAAQKHWAKREKELARVIDGTVGMYGDLEGIIGNALPRVEGLELAALPEKTKK